MRHGSGLLIALVAFGVVSCADRDRKQSQPTHPASEDIVRVYPRTEQGAAIEMRLAENEARAETTAAVVESTKQRVHLYPNIILTGADIKQTRVVYHLDLSDWSIDVDFTSQGAERLREVTTNNPDKLLTFAVGGRIVFAAQIFGPIPGGTMQITGKFTLEEADRLAQQIAGR